MPISVPCLNLEPLTGYSRELPVDIHSIFFVVNFDREGSVKAGSFGFKVPRFCISVKICPELLRLPRLIVNTLMSFAVTFYMCR